MKLNKEKTNTKFKYKKIITFLTILFSYLTIGSNSLQIKTLTSTLNLGTIKNKNKIISENIEEVFLEKSLMQKKKKKSKKGKSKEKWAGGTLNTPPVAWDKPQFKNDTLSLAMWRDINNTFVSQKINPFMLNQRKWDWKLLDKQLQEVAFDMNYQQDYGRTPEGLRGFIKYFINSFEWCDKDFDNRLSRSEFQSCLKNDTFLSIIDIPNSNYSALMVDPQYNYTNASQYTNILFDLLDPQETNYLNFWSYMHLRLYIFSWKRCSVAAPFIEETNFECAIEIAAGWKTMSRNQARKLFFLALELSGNEALRNLDFITYVSFAQAVRLYGKINGKEDNDITRNEFNLALDNNILPLRYNQDIVGFFFKLIEETDRPNQGIDLLTFCFYDFWLKLFHMQENTRKYYLTFPEYLNIFKNPLYPKFMNDALEKIPQNNLTTASFQMYTYLNISNYQDESDHFLKSFLETSASVSVNTNTQAQTSKSAKAAATTAAAKAQWSLHEAAKNISAFDFRLNDTMQFIFKVIDMNSDGFINFLDFGSLVQINYLFSKFDTYQKGRIVSGDLYDNFTNYADFPMVSYLTRLRARKFNSFPQDLYADLYSVILTLKIEDLVNVSARRTDKSTLFEVELKNIFAMVNRRFSPDAYLDRCLRGVSVDNIPLYDWECSYVQSEIRTLTFYENSFDRLTVQKNNLTLFNTVFYNIEANLPQQGTLIGDDNYGGGAAGGAEIAPSSKAKQYY